MAIRPGSPIEVAQRARREFNELTRGMSPELVKKFETGTLTAADRARSDVQAGMTVWPRCVVETSSLPSRP